MDLTKVWVVIPAYNEESTIGGVIDSLRRGGFSNLVVVDDGSTDQTFKTAQGKNVIVVSHPLNCGLGAALSTGFEFLRRNKVDQLEAVITFDADGQHQVADALKVVKPILTGRADFVVGSRLVKPASGMPVLRQLGNYLLNFLILLFFGVKTTDSQSGLRALSKKALKLIRLNSFGYEVSSEFFKEVSRHKLGYTEVDIASIYTSYSLGKIKKQSFSEALYTIRAFLLGNLD
ncbi:hypothetical protein B5M47_01585 [candidate division CPR3 bacterium 4484_211]|uniref:Glycosyltransferase 2-like domain-containing protein n=1 Tax=candidate division CPR3 bacterium 4484_211 TaxID=1968527 RepID=A0A1W9NYN6_UNCC3|nr:MAG: hypothetical protein B5M47_01585 [candidate division CPR3 bacterium 4484_211]